MRKMIISMENCQKCASLKMACPDAEAVTLQPAQILDFARAIGITSMPFVVCVGEQNELQEVLNDK